jgi:hypothetical protein
LHALVNDVMFSCGGREGTVGRGSESERKNTHDAAVGVCWSMASRTWGWGGAGRSGEYASGITSRLSRGEALVGQGRATTTSRRAGQGAREERPRRRRLACERELEKRRGGAAQTRAHHRGQAHVCWRTHHLFERERRLLDPTHDAGLRCGTAATGRMSGERTSERTPQRATIRLGTVYEGTPR